LPVFYQYFRIFSREPKYIPDPFKFQLVRKMETDLAYQIIKVLLEKQPDLVAVHKEAMHFTLQNAAAGSSIPFHPGAVKYFQEKGIKMK